MLLMVEKVFNVQESFLKFVVHRIVSHINNFRSIYKEVKKLIKISWNKSNIDSYKVLNAIQLTLIRILDPFKEQSPRL